MLRMSEIEWKGGGGGGGGGKKVEGIKITKFIYVTDIQFLSHIYRRRFLRNWMLMFNVIYPIHNLFELWPFCEWQYSQRVDNTIQFIFMSYINWKQLTFLSTTKVFWTFFSFSHTWIWFYLNSRAHKLYCCWLKTSGIIRFYESFFHRIGSIWKIKFWKENP